MNKNVPNMLSLLRILSCGLFLAIGPNAVLAAATVACIGLTDILDGYLARKYHCQSELGAQLDSVGDFFSSRTPRMHRRPKRSPSNRRRTPRLAAAP